MIGWRRDAPADPGELVDELRALVGPGGDRPSAHDRVGEALEDRFDRVVTVDVPLADDASGGDFR